MDYNEVFIKRLKNLMKEYDLNISQLAQKTDIPRTSINNWLNQKRSPKIEFICILAKFFDVTTDYLLGLED